MNENFWKDILDQIETTVDDGGPALVTDGHLLQVDIGIRFTSAFVPAGDIPDCRAGAVAVYKHLLQALGQAIKDLSNDAPQFLTPGADIEILEAAHHETPVIYEGDAAEALPGADWRPLTGDEVEVIERGEVETYPSRRVEPGPAHPLDEPSTTNWERDEDAADDGWDWDEDKYGKRPDDWGDGRGPEEL